MFLNFFSCVFFFCPHPKKLCMCNTTLRGLLHIENVSYGIEPLQNSSHFEHIFYRMDDVHQEPLKCGVSNKVMEEEITKDEEEEPPSITQLLRVRN